MKGWALCNVEKYKFVMWLHGPTGGWKDDYREDYDSVVYSLPYYNPVEERWSCFQENLTFCYSNLHHVAQKVAINKSINNVGIDSRHSRKQASGRRVYGTECHLKQMIHPDTQADLQLPHRHRHHRRVHQ